MKENVLRIHHSNRLEHLSRELTASFKGDNTHPFTSRIIITESQSLARWIKNEFCRNDGITCLVETPLPASWLWEQARQLLSLGREEDPLSLERMQWLTHEALAPNNTQIWSKIGMAELAPYLNEDETGLKRWQFAGRIADNFDRYQYYRPELIDEWSAGQDNQWMAVLWREISKDIDTQRVTLMKHFIEALANKPEPDMLPERLDLFAIHNLPRLMMDAYAAVAQHIPVHFWLLAPTPEYWADLDTPRQMARKRLDYPKNASYWQAGNPLLTQWGRQGQAFQDLLLEFETIETEDGNFHEPSRDSLLGNLQTDIYTAIDETEIEPRPVIENWPLTVQLHICHSPMRECQVLRDNLLHCLNKDESLQPEDIPVMVPEISRYAPYIKAVFGQNSPRLPFKLNDITVADEHPLTKAFLDLLNLPYWRFTRSEIHDLMRIPEVMRRFGLDETASSELAELFDELNVYWGLDKEHKTSRLKLPAIYENTWHQGFQRIMSGYALGNDRTWNNIAPALQISSQRAEQAARFFNLLQTLRDWAEILDSPRTPAEWAKQLYRLTQELFHHGNDEDSRLQKIHEILSELEGLGWMSTAPISLAVVSHWFNEKLNTQNNDGAQFYSGGITFCGMKPLRGVPFKVICLMGMQEQAFPRRKTSAEFDSMRNAWRHGDPDPAMEDRYLFLETLLASRQQLIISYTGRDIRKNDEIPPSVVVQELMDYIKTRYEPSRPIITEHPLQAFSLKNYGADGMNKERDPKVISFDKWWLAIGSAIQKHQRPSKREQWPNIKLDLPDNFSRDITINQLASFLAQPIKHFIQKRLNLYDPSDNTMQDDEPFKLDGLQTWGIRNHLIKSWLEGDNQPQQQQLMAEGLLPHGPYGNICISKLEDSLEKLLNKLKPYKPLTLSPRDVDIAVYTPDRWQITGRIQHYYEDHGILHITASKFKSENLLKLWVEHLCLNAMDEENISSHLFSLDAHYELLPVNSSSALDILKTMIGIYELGHSSPLPFIGKPGFDYVTAIKKGNDDETAINTSNKELCKLLYKSDKYTHYSEKYYAELLIRDHTPLFDDEFQDMAEKILSSLIEYAEKKE